MAGMHTLIPRLVAVLLHSVSSCPLCPARMDYSDGLIIKYMQEEKLTYTLSPPPSLPSLLVLHPSAQDPALPDNPAFKSFIVPSLRKQNDLPPLLSTKTPPASDPPFPPSPSLFPSSTSHPPAHVSHPPSPPLPRRRTSVIKPQSPDPCTPRQSLTRSGVRTLALIRPSIRTGPGLRSSVIVGDGRPSGIGLAVAFPCSPCRLRLRLPAGSCVGPARLWRGRRAPR
ncbi:hypothetical protein BDZ85DRAFT_56936 [Elsinoe ampelina]|uniref:Uncharacterized protein n=1 Tax=Elsinoe ampelina TaxID=302913 RepID=A0A6A6GMN5_9PEZI|nr:hypothetical protein BDZ85DRAFT_56936 [Elsinoe ampelina]